MGSHPTLDHHQLAAAARQLDPDDWQHGHAATHQAAEHPQVRAWPDDHPHPPLKRAAERAFDRLNPEFGVPADHHNPYGQRTVQDREAALTLGVRVTVHDSRQNDRNPVIWQAGQDYRAADAIQAAHAEPTRTRLGPERTGPER